MAKDVDRKSVSQGGDREGGQGSRMLDQVDRNMSGVVLPILIIHPNVCCMRAIPLAGTLLISILGALGFFEMRTAHTRRDICH